MKYNSISAMDAPKTELRNSQTWRNNIDECEMCQQCKEWTGVLEGCCELTAHAEDLWEDIAFELNELDSTK